MVNTYTIQSGDTLWGISKKTGISVDDIRKANPGIDEKALQINSELSLALSNTPDTPAVDTFVPSTKTPQQPQTQEYTIQKNDTLSAIAQKYNMQLSDLQKANPQITDINKIKPGQKIIIPNQIQTNTQNSTSSDTITTTTQTTQQPQNQEYTIQKNDTLSAIAQKYNMKLSDLQKANPQITDINKIKPGQKIIIPNQIQTNNQNSTSTTASTTDTKTAQTLDNSVNNPFGTNSLKVNNTTTKNTNNTTFNSLKEFNDNQESFFTSTKDFIQKKEGKVSDCFETGPEGKITIGYGHTISNKNLPEFLAKIYKENASDKAKMKQAVAEALEKPDNVKALNNAISADLKDAMTKLNIKNDNTLTQIGKDNTLTDEQIDLLLNSDMKSEISKLQTQFANGTTKINKGIKGNFDNLTDDQKTAVIDVSFNAGKSPNFMDNMILLSGINKTNYPNKSDKALQAAKDNYIKNAQKELDIFTSNNKTVYLKGLITRNYERMKLLNTDISAEAKEKLLSAYKNYYNQEHKHPTQATTWKELEPLLT